MTDDTMTAKLAQWVVLTEAATEGPWHLDAGGDAGVYTEPRTSQTSRDIASAWRREDEALIAASRTAMPALLGFVEEVLGLHKGSDFSPVVCAGCGHGFPCPTVRALTKWIGGRDEPNVSLNFP